MTFFSIKMQNHVIGNTNEMVMIVFKGAKHLSNKFIYNFFV